MLLSKLVKWARKTVPMLLAVWVALSLLPYRASASVVVELSSLSAGSYVNRSTYYEMTLPGNITNVTFGVSLAGAVYSNRPMLRTLIDESALHPVSAVSPSRISVQDASANTIAFTLTPNTTGSQRVGDVLLSLVYEESGQSVGNIVIRVVQQPDSLAGENPAAVLTSPYPATATTDAQLLAALQSPDAQPQIQIDGNAATLTYQSTAIVSWGSREPDIRLVIGDVSLLEKDARVLVPGFQPQAGGAVYDVTLPPEQVNAILAAKAGDIALTLAGLSYREDPDALEMELLGLVPAELPELPAGVTFASSDERYEVPEETSPNMIVQLADIPYGAGQEEIVDIAVLYKGVASPAPAPVRVDYGDKSLFPVLHEALAQGLVLLDGESEGIALAPVGAVTVGGLLQSYDSDTNQFVQSAGGTVTFRSSIPNGAVTNSEVSFNLPAGTAYAITRNGAPYEYLSGQPIAEDGAYRLTVTAKVPNQAALNTTDSDLGDMSEFANILATGTDFHYDFRILRQPTGKLRYYNAPTGYAVSEVLKETGQGEAKQQEPLALSSGRYFLFADEGVYTVNLKSESGGMPDYGTQVTIDLTPPIVTLGGIVNGGSAYGSVEFAADGESTQIEVFRDGAAYSAQGNAVAEPGLYRLVATDSAGNQSACEFRILYSLNMSSWTFFILLILLFGGIGGYMIYLRAHMRVR